ncbi:MAG: DNA polymerase IV [Oceanococcus sp.]
MRKIVHVDMDAFYASVEQRDRPELRGKPVAVAWRGQRSVVCAASYEAREFGLRSAMPAVTAERLCPQVVFIAPDFKRYKAVSKQVRQIFQQYTDLIEPLSLDEAYLDVTSNKPHIATASEVASRIRQQIHQELNLTASAGIAPNKFLAKIASDWRKPNGQFVVKPHQVMEFLRPLPVGRIPGVGKVTAAKLADIGITTVGQLGERDKAVLIRRFGNYGQRLHELAQGIDERPVQVHQPVQSISAEDTFAEDKPLAQLAPTIQQLAEKVWTSQQRTQRIGRTVVLKLKTREFRSLTRSHTPTAPPQSVDELAQIALALQLRVNLPQTQLYRLVGVGLSNFSEPLLATQQADLFA